MSLISIGVIPFVAIPWSNSSAQINPDELQNFSLPTTLQNMQLLRAATNSASVAKSDLVSPTVVDNQAILNENRPLLLASVNNSKNYSSSTAEEFISESSDQISIYTVHDGDTIAEIADMFNVSANTIRWANNLDKTPIKKDQQLIILPISGVKYVVKKGDTLKSIASAFKGDQDEILSYNDLESGSDIGIGDEIIIPNGEITASSVKPATTKTPTKNLASSGTSVGYFMRPVIGGVKTQGIHGHNGVDLANKLNTPILAAASGKVIVAKGGNWNGGYGTYVVISHSNGMQTLYAHMSSLNVTPGQTVTKGDVIGYMGSTGDSTGVHLHFEVRGGVNPF